MEQLPDEVRRIIEEEGTPFDSPEQIMLRLMRRGREAESSPDLDWIEAVRDSEYFTHIFYDDEYVSTDSGSNQSEAMAETVRTLVNHCDLEDNVSLPYHTGPVKNLLAEEPIDREGEEMDAYRKVSDGLYLDTAYSKGDKRKRLDELAGECNAEVHFGGDW
jgi:hypothetical protein